MSRSGYSDDCDGWSHICWRGAVTSAIRGRRGQSLLRTMASALDAMDPKELHRDLLIEGDRVCALGAVARHRGIDTRDINPESRRSVAALFDIAPALAAEIAWVNDEAGWHGRWKEESPSERWRRVRTWVEEVTGKKVVEDAAAD